MWTGTVPKVKATMYLQDNVKEFYLCILHYGKFPLLLHYGKFP